MTRATCLIFGHGWSVVGGWMGRYQWRCVHCGARKDDR